MSDPTQLEQTIREKLSVAEVRRSEQQARLKAEMSERDERLQRFDRIAARVGESIVRPRLERLAACFDNARLQPCEPVRPHHCLCLFDHTPKFPASTKLEFALFHDDPIAQGHLVYNLEILPILFQFERQDQCDFPLDGPDEERLATWVDGKVLGFVDTYMRLAEIEYYQQDNLVVDPVCGMLINKQFAAGHIELKNETYYFCVDDCRRKFQEDSTLYVSKPQA
jgi:YHS domain-containing protein